MRTLKFRGKVVSPIGKNVKAGEWIEGELWTCSDEEYGMQRYYITTHEEPPSLKSIDEQIDPATLGQNTGCVDKKGVEIYEGDRVMFGQRGKKGTVRYKRGAFVVEPDEMFVKEKGEYCFTPPFTLYERDTESELEVLKEKSE